MNILRTTCIAVAALALVACESTEGREKEIGGTLVGAAVGGLLGSQIGGGTGQLAATAGGTLLGAYLGREVGKSLDRADAQYAERSAQRSLETTRTGTVSTWRNPDSGHSGTFTPTHTYKSADGMDCRDFEQTVTIGGETDKVFGTACRAPDGTWRIVNAPR